MGRSADHAPRRSALLLLLISVDLGLKPEATKWVRSSGSRITSEAGISTKRAKRTNRRSRQTHGTLCGPWSNWMGRSADHAPHRSLLSFSLCLMGRSADHDPTGWGARRTINQTAGLLIHPEQPTAAR